MREYLGNSIIDAKIYPMVVIDDILTEDEIDVEVDFYYSPPEKPVMYYSDMSGYPGCSATVEIYHLYDSNDRDWVNRISTNEYERLEEYILNMKPDFDY